jgi:transcription termination factor Rho
MTAEQQLERSVLEGKERDELSAIAQAMSLKTNSRMKKADIIDQILDATGVTSGSGAAASNGDGEAGDANGAKPPRRSRSASSAAAVADSADTASARDATPTTAAANSAGAGAGATDGADGSAGGATNATATATEATPGTGNPGPAIFVEPPDLTTGSEPAQRQNGQSQGGGGQGGQGGGGQGGQSGQGGQGGQGNRNRQNQNRNQNQNSQADGDVGNRRSRRRRGRERGGPGQGGELQGGGQDQTYTGELVEVKGMLDLRDEGYGFLRCDGYLASSKDVYVSISQARRFALRRGDYVEGACRPAGNNEKYPALLRIDTISGLDPDEARDRPRFEDLTPLFPDSRLNLEMPGDKDNLTARIVDLLSPIGKGQRGMIVSPPKAGKTTVMKQIAHSIEANNPDVHLMVLLVDERPEEVTDMRRTVKGEVIASTFDRPSDEHTQVAELAIERAKRLVEMGRDVVIILDGITRLARAYNLAAPATGRIMSGGVDSGALYPPKKFFGAARNIEEGGSLTILASALVETGSKMDEVIFEEFKGTGNMELRLDRRLSERRLYPAIDVNASSTRHEELLFERGQLQQVWKLRRVLNALASDGKDAAGLELLMDKIRTTASNDEFLAEIAKGPGA